MKAFLRSSLSTWVRDAACEQAVGSPSSYDNDNFEKTYEIISRWLNRVFSSHISPQQCVTFSMDTTGIYLEVVDIRPGQDFRHVWVIKVDGSLEYFPEDGEDEPTCAREVLNVTNPRDWMLLSTVCHLLNFSSQFLTSWQTSWVDQRDNLWLGLYDWLRSNDDVLLMQYLLNKIDVENTPFSTVLPLYHTLLDNV